MTAGAPPPGRWADLGPRILSAAVMVLVGGAAVWRGGAAFTLLAVVASACMMLELAKMTRGEGRDASLLLGFAGGLAVLLNVYAPQPWVLLLIPLPVVLGLLTPRRDPWVFAAYALVIVLTGLSLVAMRQFLGLAAVLWLLAVVIASDVAGYFAGRLLGGPKFWPAVSPKKTWSGTAAGWVGAALVGLGFWWAGQGGTALIWVSPLIALAGQMGDIAESAIKRRAGVKDASNLIPGHGGVMDRFDALAIAAIAATALHAMLPVLPVAAP